MQHARMPLQRPLAVSLCVHVLIFGTALAFAQYTGASFQREGAAITVALVSGGSGAAPGRGQESVRRNPSGTITPALTAPAAASPRAAEERAEAIPGEAGPRAEGGAGDGTATGVQAEGTGAVVASNGEGGAGAFSLEQWRQLYSAIEGAKTYPRLARERGIEGTVLVRFKVLPSGTVEAVNIVKSSGAQILDEASVKTVYRAAPMPYVNGWVEVPMSYVLK